MSVLNRFSSLVTAAVLVSTPAYAGVCDYKLSRLMGAAAAAVGGTAAAAGAGLQAAGYYTLVHSTSGLVMLGSTAAGPSAAGTIGMIAGSAGTGAAIAGMLMAPLTLAVGAVTVIGVGSLEGACYFQIERIADPYEVRGIVENIAANDPAVSVVETEDGPELVLELEDGQERYMVRDLYIADGDLMHRDRLRNTNLGPVAYVVPEAADSR